jgi:hypothetical protein
VVRSIVYRAVHRRRTVGTHPSEAAMSEDEATDEGGEVVEVTSVAEIDIDGDGVADAIEVTTIAAADVDGDGVADAIVMTRTTAVDVDGDGVPDIVEVVEAVAADIDGDGEISDDEIAVSETVYVRDDEAAD